jgi:steroid delta-isomerase
VGDGLVTTDCAGPLAAYCRLFAGLRPADLDRLGDVYTPDARFKDPFNDVRGPEAIRGVFAHMYAVTVSPRFEVLEQAAVGSAGYIRWRFCFATKGRGAREWSIEGVSRVAFAVDGRVAEHVDYWDPVEGLYGRLPGLGWLFRLPRRWLAAPS